MTQQASTSAVAASAAPSAARLGDPNVATLMTWLVPGAGHLYLGRIGFGVAAFLVIEGLYLLGYFLSDGRVLEFLDPELRSAMAPSLTPEVGNLGALIAHYFHHGFGDGTIHAWPEAIRYGSMLTATSGVANAVLMTHAHLSARVLPSQAQAPLSSPTAAVGLTWLLPGLGHIVQGRKVRGLVVMVLLVGLFVGGSLLAEGANLSRERHFYYWAGQFLVGGVGLIGEVVFGAMRVTREIRFVDVGLLLACLGGLLNVLAMLDVYGWGEARVLGRDPEEVVEPEGAGE